MSPPERTHVQTDNIKHNAFSLIYCIGRGIEIGLRWIITSGSRVSVGRHYYPSKTTAVDVGCQRQLIGLSQALGLVVRKPSFTCTSAGNALQLFNVDRKLLKRMQ